MKINWIFNKVLILLAISISICLSIDNIANGQLYEVLIKLSIIPVTLLPVILKRVFKIKIYQVEETIYLIFIFFSHFLGSIVQLYNQISYYDTLMHFLSGIMVAFLATDILVRNKMINKSNITLQVLFIMGLGFLVAGMWEIFEFTCDNLFDKDAQKVLTTGVTDTMKDIIAAGLGSLLFVVSFIYEVLEDSKLGITRFMEGLK